MPRIEPLDTTNAYGSASDLLKQVEEHFGMTPNITRVMANSPAVLKAYLAFGDALSEGELSESMRRQIALTVAEENQCEYCLSANAALGRTAGLSEEQVRDARDGSSPNSRTRAVLTFAKLLVKNQGHVHDEDVESLRRAGLTEGEITEVVATVAFNIFSNFINLSANTEVDFPRIKPLQPAIGA